MVRDSMRDGAIEWRDQLRNDPSARKAGAFLIGLGSTLGVILGFLLIAVNPADLLDGQGNSSKTANVDGMIVEALESDTEGGEPIQNATLTLYTFDGDVLAGPILSNSAGRFSFEDVDRIEVRLEVDAQGRVSEHRLMVPGDSSQLVISMERGQGEAEVIDLRGDSHLDDSALLGTAIALGTILTGLAGISASISAYQGKAYRRTQLFAFLGLWSRGGVFVGPMLILLGMAIVTSTKSQFLGKPARVAIIHDPEGAD